MTTVEFLVHFTSGSCIFGSLDQTNDSSFNPMNRQSELKAAVGNECVICYLIEDMSLSSSELLLKTSNHSVEANAVPIKNKD